MSSRFGQPRLGIVLPLVALACSLGCDRGKGAGQGGPTASASSKPAAPVASGLPGDPERVSKLVNPDNVPAYSGPTGGVRGLVTATGDPVSIATEHLAQIKGACPEARETYGHVFREGPGRSLADVLVGVTGYSGYVPEKQPMQVVEARGCAFDTRSIALTFGQTIELVSKDNDAYVPNLIGSRMAAQLFALPRGAASKLYPPDVGHYLLTDDIKVFMLADVFVLKYATHDVTKLDGRYEITGIPVGKVRVSAFLPSTNAVVEKEVEIQEGKLLELSFQLPFDAKAHQLKAAAAAEAAKVAKAAKDAKAAPSADAAPAPSAPTRPL